MSKDLCYDIAKPVITVGRRKIFYDQRIHHIYSKKSIANKSPDMEIRYKSKNDVNDIKYLSISKRVKYKRKKIIKKYKYLKITCGKTKKFPLNTNQLWKNSKTFFFTILEK